MLSASAMLQRYLVMSAFLFVTLSQGSVAQATVKIQCPCTVNSSSHLSIEISATLYNSNQFDTAPNVTLALQGSTDATFGAAYTFARYQLGSIDSLERLAISALQLPLDIGLPADTFYLRLAVINDAGNMLDSVRLNRASILGYEYGEVFDSRQFTVYPSKPMTFTLSKETNRFSLSIPSLIASDPRQSSGDITLQLVASNSAVIYGSFIRNQYEVVLSGGVPSNSEASFFVEGKLADALDNSDYLHALFKDDSGKLMAWRTIYHGTDPLPERILVLSDIDYLTDTDADGVPDFSERLAGTSSSDPADIPNVPILNVLLLATESLVARTDFDLQVTHVKNYASDVLNDSGVRLDLRFSQTYRVEPSNTLNNSELLNQMFGREAAFANIDANKAQESADIIILLDTFNPQDNNCGIAYLSGYATHGNVAANLTATTANVGVVDVGNAACTSRTLIHEIGHLLGLGHSKRQDDAGTFPWSVGHGVDDAFVTVMAYTTEFSNAPERDLFSTPDIECAPDTPCGVSREDLLNGADAVLSLNAVATQVAQASEGFAPTLSLRGANPQVILQGEAFSDPGFDAFDYEDGDLNDVVSRSGSVDTDRLGTYQLTYRVSDAQGNTTEATRSVVVLREDADTTGTPDTIDSDGDGLSDERETQLGTDPLKADSDADGWSDGEELNEGTEPLSADSQPEITTTLPLWLLYKSLESSNGATSQ